MKKIGMEKFMLQFDINVGVLNLIWQILLR